MYIEIEQIVMLLFVGAAAFFSYRQGKIDGVTVGVHETLSDLSKKGIVAIYQDDDRGEVVVGRYDENDWSEDLIEEEYDEDHW